MELPKFIEKQIEGRFEYHLPISYNRFLAQTIFDNSKFDLADEIKDKLFSFIEKYNISSYVGWDENSILYSLALKTLALNKKCLLVYFDKDSVISEIQPNTSKVKVEWWNSIQFMDGDELCQSFGFQTPEMFLKAVNYYNKDLSNRYFYVCEIEYERINKYTNIYNSDVTNWFFILCEEQNIQSIISTLSKKDEKPNVDKLLKLSSYTVNIQIGGDEGYLDYILIQSKINIDNLIQEIEIKQLKFISEYQELLKECKPFDDEWKVYFYKERYLEIIKNYC